MAEFDNQYYRELSKHSMISLVSGGHWLELSSGHQLSVNPPSISPTSLSSKHQF